jgi:hypothetical protein
MNSSVENENGRMIFISDLEGCAEFKPFTTFPQSREVCSEDFFNNIEMFLNEDGKNNKVAFLGDYFDGGNFFSKIIKRIILLYKKYSEGIKNKKVYIILGNRDINKLRLSKAKYL